ncbi:glycosyltransferase family 4 protein [Microvirga brassicacearum]|uniref:Glycosyltransferase family 4 protein n=2 Tax=Microvirga brassicacearum TaxID=2580413 RepID=A0A5N3P8F8_9HYPH|nr:glycosyltransferase family 4 protein [Microvirga brassicacearum]
MTTDTVGGVWQYALDLAEGLRRREFLFTLAVLGPPPSADQLAMARMTGVELVMTGLPLDWTAKSPDEVERGGKVIAALAAEKRADIVHLNSAALAAGARYGAPVVAVCHSCVATWWQAVRSGPMPQEFVWRTELVRRGYETADLLLAPTTAFARMTVQVYGLSKSPLLVPNGRRPSRHIAQRDLEPFAFTAGRLWDEGKNLRTLDRAAARLPTRVLAAGAVEGPNGARIDLRHVEALGRLSDDEVAQYLAGRPVFVSTARYEPFGLAALEAAQAGCALVLSDIPTFRELWGGAAMFVPAEDDEAVAHAIAHLFQEPTVRIRLGDASQERARSYGSEATSARIVAAYRSLLGARAESSSFEDAAL